MNKLFHGFVSFLSVKQNQHTLFSTGMLKNASPTKTMSLLMRFLEEQKHESLYMIILFTSMTSLLSFFSVLYLGHKFLRARTTMCRSTVNTEGSNSWQ